MSALSRQNTLFVAEDWIRIYEALENVDFRAYDFDNLVDALMSYLRVNYPEEFNDWIASSEFVTKVEILAWLSQNIAFRVDLNTRENFLATAERRDSLIRLAQNISYKVSRVRGASGVVKIESIRTTQQLQDSNGTDLQDRVVRWNDPRDEDWFERFIIIMNAALTTRTQFGSPLTSFTSEGIRTDQFVFNSVAPLSGTYPFNAQSNGVDLPFDIYNANLNPDTGVIEEISPTDNNAFNVLYRLDGRGFGSTNTGFFLPIKQGNLTFQDEQFESPIILRTVDLNTQNINNDDFFVQQVDDEGVVQETWTQIDTVFGESVSFNTQAADLQNIFEVDTLSQDRVRVRFGDGTFGTIPVGRFRFWFRTSNPQPLSVKPVAIQNQTITIPYVADNSLFYLTVNYSLQESLTNAATSETNFDIRTRANRVFYTQNRMITAQDYNSFFLTDNSIEKVKTVNRTFAGHSRFARLNDPTSLYQNVKAVAEDGRFYQDDTVEVQTISADITVNTPEEIINVYLKPLIRKQDKQLLYYNRYTEIFFSTDYVWSQTSIIAGQSRGNVADNFSVVQQVGDTASVQELTYIDADAVIRYDSPSGPTVSVDQIVDDGDATDGVILTDTIPNGTSLISVFPALRNRFTNSELIEMETRLEDRIDFGLSWNQATEAWQFINFDDLDKTSDFSLANQGNTTAAALDASWMFMLEFLPGGTSDQWRITDRGLGLFFESAREIDFVFANTDPVIDPDSGEVVQDEIKILACNESRDSLRRRGLEPFGGNQCDLNAITFVANGTDTCFKTSESPLIPENTVVLLDGVLQSNGVDYEIQTNVSGDLVCFFTAPSADSQIEIRISRRFLNATQTVVSITGDGVSDEFNLGQEVVTANNVISFLDGVIQNSSLDFGIGTVGSNASIVYNEILGSDVEGIAYVLSGIDSSVFTKSNFLGDGVQTDFIIPTLNQTSDTVLVSVDGVIQSPTTYTVSGTVTNSTVAFDTAPLVDVRIRIISVPNPSFARTAMFNFTTNGVQNTFALSGISQISSERVIVALDGIMQHGDPWGPNPVWQITGGNNVFFNSAPVSGLDLTIFVIAGAVGTLSTDLIQDTTADNLGDIDTSSCLVNYLGEDVVLTPADLLRHDDGYTNKNGLFVVPVDSDRDGVFDRPFVFRDLTLLDGFTDLVLWRKVDEFGFNVLDPINQLTQPKGTYGLSSQGDIQAGDSFDSALVADGDIHYDLTTDTWLVANGITDTWDAASDQTLYEFKIGRDHLRFLWTHYAPEASRIDPSVSNVMDAYILTKGFDTTFRTWLEQDGDVANQPEPETSEQLRLQFQDFENFKAMSDSIIYHSARYKLLFGPQAVSELQAVFKIIQTPGSTVSESDLRLRVLAAINDYFDVRRWDFGEKFFFTELSSFIHAQLAPDLQTVVIVPRGNNQAFGRLFQVRSEPDELFVSSAGPDDIEIVPSLTDEELRIGSFA